MTTTVKIWISAFAISLASLTTAAEAQPFEEWDADQDGVLSPAEFEPGIESAGWFEDWDADDDDRLAEGEFETGLFGLFDDNDDEALSVDEWDEGIDSWYGEGTVDFSFTNWDADGNGALSRDEFTDALGATGLYGGFAGYDRQVTRTEFDDGLFDWFEDDDDEALGEDEWDPLFGLLD